MSGLVIAEMEFAGGIYKHILSTGHTVEYFHELTGKRNLRSHNVSTPLDDPDTNQFPHWPMTKEEM